MAKKKEAAGDCHKAAPSRGPHRPEIFESVCEPSNRSNRPGLRGLMEGTRSVEPLILVTRVNQTPLNFCKACQDRQSRRMRSIVVSEDLRCDLMFYMTMMRRRTAKTLSTSNVWEYLTPMLRDVDPPGEPDIAFLGSIFEKSSKCSNAPRAPGKATVQTH